MLSKEQIVQLLATNDKAVCRALVLLNERQTSDEQAGETTRYDNGRGFRPCHAKMGSSMAKQIARKGRLELSPKQLEYWRKPMACGNMKIGIYWKQLQEEAAKKAAAKPAAQPTVAPAVDLGNEMERRMVLTEMLDHEIAIDGKDCNKIAAEISEIDKFMERIRAGNNS